MIKYLAIPLILVGCTAPVTDPPAHAIPQEQMEMIWEALEYVKEYDVLKNRTEPNDAITSALDDFWEETEILNEEQE
jgi:hypothetical protein